MKIELEIILTLILGLLISYIIISSILGNNLFVKWILDLIKFTKRKKILYELEKINYFKYHSKEQREGFINIINIYGTQQITGIAFQYDIRTFLIDENSDNGALQIDNIGQIEKFSGLAISNNFNNEDFITLCKKLEILINIDREIEFLEAEKFSNLEFKINNINHKITYPYLEDENLIYKFVSLINQELTKIGSDEKFYLHDYYPAILILANKKILKYYSKQEINFLSPEEWIKNKTIIDSNL